MIKQLNEENKKIVFFLFIRLWKKINKESKKDKSKFKKN